MSFTSFFFWTALGIFIWQLLIYVRMDSDQEWYRKHPRPGDELGKAIDDESVPPPPPITGRDLHKSGPETGYRINLGDK